MVVEVKKSMSKKRAPHGTQEWAYKTINCCTGCPYDCKYCYAKEGAIRRNQVTPDQWPLQRVRQKNVNKGYRKKYPGRVMFPSSHDINKKNCAAYCMVLRKLLEAGNDVLIVSKPDITCIGIICRFFEEFRSQILFRFTIGACDDAILSYWEPGAPKYEERKASLIHAYENGFETSISVEPMLDSANIDALISDLSPYVTDVIWIGTMNHLKRLEKGSDMVLKQEIERIRQSQTDSIIEAIYQRHKGNLMIKYKKEIKKIVGLPIPKENGLDM